MKIDTSKIKKILIISLSNIGDVILTFPVIDILKENFPAAKLAVVVGPKAEGVLKNNPHIAKVYIFNKHGALLEKINWLLALRRERFDLVVDLRNSAIPFFIAPRYRTSVLVDKTQNLHMKQKHLNCLRGVYPFSSPAKHHYALYIDKESRKYIDDLLKTQVKINEKLIIVSPGAANQFKRWTAEGFAEICDKMINMYQAKIVLVGDGRDEEAVDRVVKQMKNRPLNLSGRTNLTQLAALIERSRLVVANDSGVMHMASYLNVPVLAIFGPTNPQKYGPWSQRSYLVESNAFCVSCGKSGCKFNHECMDFISPERVFNAVQAALGPQR